jgi:hypothetical protein
MMTSTDVTVYYSSQMVDSFPVQPLPINSAAEKERAVAYSKQRVEVMVGRITMVLLVCDDLTDSQVYGQVKFLKEIAQGVHPNYPRSRYWEDSP